MASGTLNKVNGFIRISATPESSCYVTAYANPIIRLVVVNINTQTTSGSFGINIDADYTCTQEAYAPLRGGVSYMNIAVGGTRISVVEPPAWAVGQLIFPY